MKQTNVLVSVPLEEKHLAAIRAISPQVNLMYNPDKETLRNIIAQAEVLLAFRPPPELAPPPRLRWMQLWSAGIDDVLDTRLVQEVPLLTTASSVHIYQVAEYAFCCMLMLAHRFALMLQAQFQRRPLVRRRELTPSELRDKTLAIVGLGNIGREIARLGQAFGMRVLATRRSYAQGLPAQEPCVDQLFPPAQLLEMLAQADFVALCLPLTRESRHLIDEKALRAMKPTAYLINIARGEIVNEAALLRALREGWIAGAGLDVVQQEPLDYSSNPLLELPNVIVTPHVAGLSDRYAERVTALFCDNLRRYLAGEPLRNLVDRERGY